MKNPSGSSLERASHCPASFALNQASHTGEAAIKGTANHDAIEAGISTRELSNLPEVVQVALRDATSIEVEVAYAINVETGEVRCIGSRIGRNYGEVDSSEIVLTVDAVVTSDSGVTVWDWKSRKRVTPAAKNLQIRAGVVAVMTHLGLSEARGAIGYLDDAETDVATFDRFDAALFMSDMRTMLYRIGSLRLQVAKGETPPVHAGPWCDYCPAIAYCPAQTRLARTMLGELTDVEKQIAFMPSDQVGRAWALLRQIQGLAERVEASIKLRARQDVVPLPNGKRLALVDSSRTGFDKKKALAWIAERGGDAAQFQSRTHFETVREINMPTTAANDEETERCAE